MNERRIQQGEKCDEQPKANQDRHPPDGDERQMQLRMNGAVGFIVMMLIHRLAGSFRQRIFPGILGGVVQIVEVFQRARSEREKAQQQQIRRQRLH